jgi:hypothetical protein
VDGLGNFKDLSEDMRANGEVAPVMISETPTVSWN